VYSGGSGDTHVLDPIAALLVYQLMDHYCESTELAERIAALLNLEVSEDLRAKLQETLHRLDELGLLEPLTP